MMVSMVRLSREFVCETRYRNIGGHYSGEKWRTKRGVVLLRILVWVYIFDTITFPNVGFNTIEVYIYVHIEGKRNW